MPSKYTGGLPRWVYRALAPRELPLSGWHGGLDLQNYPEVPENALVQSMNARIDEVGRGLSGMGDIKNGGGAVPGGRLVISAFYSRTLDTVLWQASDGTFWKWGPGAGSPAFSTSTQIIGGGVPVELKPCAYVEFNGAVVVASPTNGIYVVTATLATWTLATMATVIKPFKLAVWQNKVWAIGDQTFPTRIWACNAGNAGAWTTATDWVEIREPDDAPCIAILSTAQQDFQGKGSLLIYKRKSVHRINSSDATVGFSFTTLGVGVGCLGRDSVAAAQTLAYSIDETGVWVTDGLSRPDRISLPINPLFDASGINSLYLGAFPAKIGLHQAGVQMISWERYIGFTWWITPGVGTQQLVVYDTLLRVWSTMYRGPSFANGLTPDLRAGAGIVPIAAESLLNSFSGPQLMFDGVANHAPYTMFVQGFTPAWRFQSAWLIPGGGARFNARRLRVRAKSNSNAAVVVTTRLDYDETTGRTNSIPAAQGTAIKPYDFFSFGKPRAISFQVDVAANGVGDYSPDPSLTQRVVPQDLISALVLEWSLGGRF